MPGEEAIDVLQMTIAHWQTPDVEGFVNDAESLLHGHAGQSGGLEVPFCSMLQDRPGRSATCPSPGRWNHPLQLNSWEPLQLGFSMDTINRVRLVSHPVFKVFKVS